MSPSSEPEALHVLKHVPYIGAVVGHTVPALVHSPVGYKNGVLMEI